MDTRVTASGIYNGIFREEIGISYKCGTITTR